ncbi:hypothetical protein BDC45DRAFT_341523 [Circinella umbellata]|nr:hypothetical protein BDC45DRAFT_341523 [Circinella umbellata]
MTVQNIPIQPSIIVSETYRHVRWSPTGLAKLNGCILAVITTYHQVTLYSTTKLGEYLDTCFDMTPLIKEHVLGSKDKFSTPDELDHFQTLCCAWSSLIIPDLFVQKPALIALGNKSGEITIWSYHSDLGALFCTTFQPHQSFVNSVEWTQWRVNGNRYTAYIISTCSDGTSALTSVELEAKVDYDTGETTIQSVTATIKKTWFESDPSYISLLSVWNDLKNGGNVIKTVLCKNARVQIGSIIIDDDDDLVDHWSEYYLEHSTMGLTGVNWSVDGSQVYLYTYDCQNISLFVDDNAKHTYNSELSAKTNERLLNKMNQQWLIDQDKMDRETQATANAVVPKTWSVEDSATGLFSAVLFTLRPELDMHYFPRNNLDIIYLGFIAHRERQDPNTIQEVSHTIERYIKDPAIFYTLPIQAILHEILQYIIDEDESDGMIKWLDVVDNLMSQGHYKKSTDSLAKKIFCDDRATAARVLLRVQINLQNYELAEDAIRKLSKVCRKAKSFLNQQFAATVLDYIYSLSDDRLQKLDEDDAVIILLLCDRILTQEEPIPFALEQIQTTCKRLQSYLPQVSKELEKEVGIATLLLDGQDPQETLPGREKCPGCQELVIVEKDRLGVCPSMHIWV